MSAAGTLSIADALNALRSVADLLRVGSTFIQDIRPLFGRAAPPPYEVESFEATLFVHDRDGHHATYRKRERVRFTHHDVRVVAEREWGGGRQFLGHRTTHGRVLSHRRIGSEQRHAVELAQPGRKGELRTLSSTRTIRDGFRFPKDRWLETEVDHLTKRLTMRVVFPPGLRPRGARFSSLHEGTRSLQVKPFVDGGTVLSLVVKNPPIGERYTISWGAM